MNTPYWLPPAGLSHRDELAYLESSAAFARGKVIGISHAYGLTFVGRARRRIGRLLIEGDA